MKIKQKLLLFPGIAFIFLLMIVPLIHVFSLSFDLGFNRYLDFISDPFYQKILLRTLRVSFITMIISLLLGLPTGYYIAKQSPKRKSILMALALFPLLTNAVVRSFAWITILGQKGIINSLLLKTGIIQDPISMLYTEFAVIIGMVYLFLPLMIVTLVGVLEQIDDDVVQASASLGASPIKTFFKIVLPLALPGILVGSVLVFTGSLTAYTTPQLLGGNKQMMLATLIYQQTMTSGQWQMGSMIAVIILVITVVVMKLMNVIATRLDGRMN